MRITSEFVMRVVDTVSPRLGSYAKEELFEVLVDEADRQYPPHGGLDLEELAGYDSELTQVLMRRYPDFFVAENEEDDYEDEECGECGRSCDC